MLGIVSSSGINQTCRVLQYGIRMGIGAQRVHLGQLMFIPSGSVVISHTRLAKMHSIENYNTRIQIGFDLFSLMSLCR